MSSGSRNKRGTRDASRPSFSTGRVSPLEGWNGFPENASTSRAGRASVSQKQSPLHRSHIALPANEGLEPDHRPSPAYLATRRPSWTNVAMMSPQQAEADLHDTEDSLRKALQIDMKNLVGDGLGNMSISPTCRDVVLAARRGLFIIDLESPLEVPRFLPQGGTWDVADVQWNPHPSRAEYVVSTSSEKMLVWNLNSPVSSSPTQNPNSSTAIQHILHSHYRAITDVNCHTSEPDIVCSTSIDSWIWAWDMRATERPIFGLCVFNGAGTQVKWNRKDPNILASAHGHEVLVWDRRKGSLPLSRIQAHQSRIYGLDWSHESRNDLLTCSLDKTIKMWDVTDPCHHDADDWQTGDSVRQPDTLARPHRCLSKTCIRTNYPVWRARNLPFGRGLLSLPQRGQSALEMFSLDSLGSIETPKPVGIFQGHTDVVKEFVWRQGGIGSRTYQLITWSKDRTLRFWPLDDEVMQKVGFEPSTPTEPDAPVPYPDFSFRSPPSSSVLTAGLNETSLLSAPVGRRSILADIRGPLPVNIASSSSARPKHPLLRRPSRSGQAHIAKSTDVSGKASTSALPSMSLMRRRGTMSRGSIAGKASSQMDALAWLTSVRVGASNSTSTSGSRERDTDNTPPVFPETETQNERGSRSPQHGKEDKERRESENQIPYSLQDEITTALTKLTPYKVKLEKHDLTKKRTCTLSLHGPWGEFSAVYLRVTFSFPRDYPFVPAHVELERNPLITPNDRAFILRRLKSIRERNPLCLEPCLRFLLFASEDSKNLAPAATTYSQEESSDEEEDSRRKAREITVALLRNNKNLAEPRTSQGTFGPNGELVCFFRAPPRFVRPGVANPSDSPARLEARSNTQTARQLQPPSLLGEAVRLLEVSTLDRALSKSNKHHHTTTDSILNNTLNNMLTYSTADCLPNSASQVETAADPNIAFGAPRLSTVFIRSTLDLAGPDKAIAARYMFWCSSLTQMCRDNALAARDLGRYDHERVFKTLGALVMQSSSSLQMGLVPIARMIIEELCRMKDIQMLAMVSATVIQAVQTKISPTHHPDVASPLKTSSDSDYSPLGHVGPSWASSSPSSPHLNVPPSSPRGSWPSFTQVKNLLAHVSDGAEGISPENRSTSPRSGLHSTTIAVPTRRRLRRRQSSPRILTSALASPTVQSEIPSLSWEESRTKPADQQGQHNATNIVIKKAGGKRVMFTAELDTDIDEQNAISPDLLLQLHCHIKVYSEILLRWQLYTERLELLKCVQKGAPHNPDIEIGTHRTCTRCFQPLQGPGRVCQACFRVSLMPLCSICRIPIRGLSQACIKCKHVSHIGCWKTLGVPICPSGCGCICGTVLPDHPVNEGRLSLTFEEVPI